jgi:hypothetical protein
VLEVKLVNVKVGTTTQIVTQDNRPATRLQQLLLLRVRHPRQLPEPPTRMLPMVATKTISRCGMPPWRNSSNNKGAKVKVSNDKTGRR